MGHEKTAAPFVVVWKKELRDSKTLPASCRSFGAWLETWADRDGTNCWPSIATLVGLGYSKTTVYRNLSALEAAGWLRIKHGGGRLPDGTYEHNGYTLTLPPEGAGTETGRSVYRDGKVTVPPEGHDHSLRPLPLTTTETTPEVAGTETVPLVPKGKDEEDVTNTPTTKAELRAKSITAGLDLETLKDLIFETTGKTSDQTLAPAEMEKVARAISAIEQEAA
jgi:hypothetical protein